MSHQDPKLEVFRNIIKQSGEGSLMSQLGFDKLPEGRQQELLDMMIDTVLDRVFLRISSALTEADLESLAKMEDGEEIMKLLQNKVPNFSAIVGEEAEKYRLELQTQTEEIMAGFDQEESSKY